MPSNGKPRRRQPRKDKKDKEEPRFVFTLFGRDATPESILAWIQKLRRKYGHAERDDPTEDKS